MAFPQFEIEFTKGGTAFNPDRKTQLLQSLEQFTDLFVVSHGWNNDMADARQLYDDLFLSVDKVINLGLVQGIATRRFGVARIFWPSKRFAEEVLIPGGGAATAAAQDENARALVQLLEQLKEDPERLGETKCPERVKAMTRAQELIPQLEHDIAARREFVDQLRSILDPRSIHPEDGSDLFFSKDPEELLMDQKSGDAGCRRKRRSSVRIKYKWGGWLARRG